ncbi:type II toxin-antitoxin system VapC family toxin [Sphingosinicellaceae bacterium]|nr:type II toxin-antitoxin system VapC family toxin [Sphingosinicellaceae bacterium]
MNVVDSSGWIEFLIEGANGPAFAEVIADHNNLLVPTIAIYEVYKWVSRQSGDAVADLAAATMRSATVIDLDPDIAVMAADLSAQRKLAMADAIILATAQRFDATLWTQDRDFDGIDRVRYLPRK